MAEATRVLCGKERYDVKQMLPALYSSKILLLFLKSHSVGQWNKLKCVLNVNAENRKRCTYVEKLPFFLDL